MADERCRKCGSYGYCYFQHDCGRLVDADLDEVQQETGRQMATWRETLDYLAQH